MIHKKGFVKLHFIISFETVLLKHEKLSLSSGSTIWKLHIKHKKGFVKLHFHLFQNCTSQDIKITSTFIRLNIWSLLYVKVLVDDEAEANILENCSRTIYEILLSVLPNQIHKLYNPINLQIWYTMNFGNAQNWNIYKPIVDSHLCAYFQFSYEYVILHNIKQLKQLCI